MYEWLKRDFITAPLNTFLCKFNAVKNNDGYIWCVYMLNIVVLQYRHNNLEVTQSMKGDRLGYLLLALFIFSLVCYVHKSFKYFYEHAIFFSFVIFCLVLTRV